MRLVDGDLVGFAFGLVVLRLMGVVLWPWWVVWLPVLLLALAYVQGGLIWVAFVLLRRVR